MKRFEENIAAVLGCETDEILWAGQINRGMTNSSYVFSVGEKEYVYRDPGKGSELLIDRHREKAALETAHRYGFDPTYIYMDEDEGWKISKRVEAFREPDYFSDDDSAKVAERLSQLHSVPERGPDGLEPWEDSFRLEARINGLPAEMKELKEKIGRLREKIQGDGIEKCFCHGDTYKDNWMLTSGGETVLIDWEYAGYADPGVDIGYYIIDAEYSFEQAREFIKKYLKEENEEKIFHFMVYAAIMAYYWTLWAIYKESGGMSTGGALERWKRMAYKYADIRKDE